MNENQEFVGGRLDAGRELGDAVGEQFHLSAWAVGSYESRTANAAVGRWTVHLRGWQLDCWIDGGVGVGDVLFKGHNLIITCCF